MADQEARIKGDKIAGVCYHDRDGMRYCIEKENYILLNGEDSQSPEFVHKNDIEGAFRVMQSI